MEQKGPKPMTPFDSLVTPDSLYTLKLMLPYTPSQTQRTLAVYIKFLELRYTIEHFHGFSSQNTSASLLDGLKDYLGPEEKEMMEQTEMMMHMMEMMQNTPDMSGMPDISDMFQNMSDDTSCMTDSGEWKGDSDDE